MGSGDIHRKRTYIERDIWGNNTKKKIIGK